jgi:hypothetical protein
VTNRRLAADIPSFDELAAEFHYDTLTGWAFEDGPCRVNHPWISDAGEKWEWCDCPRPWSDAWERLCYAPYAIYPEVRAREKALLAEVMKGLGQ